LPAAAAPSALFVTGTHLSISAAMGFISIFGIAVQDAIIVVTYAKKMWAEKHSLDEGALLAAERGPAPALMTASVGADRPAPGRSLPGHRCETQKPLAIVVIGGMLTLAVLLGSSCRPCSRGPCAPRSSRRRHPLRSGKLRRLREEPFAWPRPAGPVTVNVPPEKLFDVITDYEKYPEFLPEVKKGQAGGRAGGDQGSDLQVGHQGQGDSPTRSNIRRRGRRSCRGRMVRAR